MNSTPNDYQEPFYIKEKKQWKCVNVFPELTNVEMIQLTRLLNSLTCKNGDGSINFLQVEQYCSGYISSNFLAYLTPKINKINNDLNSKETTAQR